MDHQQIPGPDHETLSHVLLHEVLKRYAQAVILLDGEGNIVFCSDNIREIGGYLREELIGKNAFDFLLPAEVSISKQHHEELFRQMGHAASALMQIRHKEGSLIWVEVIAKELSHTFFLNNLFILVKKSSNSTEQEKSLARVIARAKEEEREYLATELHDNVNQIITTTKLLVDTARTSHDKEELLEQCSHHLQLAAEEIRRLSYSLASYDLHEYGLWQAVNSFIETLKRVAAIHFSIRIDVPSEKALTPDQRLHVYRIIQEAVINTLKHAEASEVFINLEREMEMIHLTIRDNGKGFSISRQKPTVGLSSITGRVKLLKGHFHITAPADKGTTIEIHFPV
jgi:PAS domain S-box-containing protein